MSVFVEFNLAAGHPVAINVDQIAVIVPHMGGGTDIHLAGGMQVVANKSVTWTYVVTESYEDVLEAIAAAEETANMAVAEMIETAGGDWEEEEEAFPTGWKPNLKVTAKDPAAEAEAIKFQKQAANQTEVDWDDFKEPPHHTHPSD